MEHRNHWFSYASNGIRRIVRRTSSLFIHKQSDILKTEPAVQHEIEFFAEVTPVIDISVRSLCGKPYHGHPRGCPNLGKKKGCPPDCLILEETLNLDKPVFIIYNSFDLFRQYVKMKRKHPQCSDRSARCCLYWQQTARKHLREKIIVFLSGHPGLTIITCPEAQGVNVTETMAQIGIELEWPPRLLAYQVALAGTAR